MGGKNDPQNQSQPVFHHIFSSAIAPQEIKFFKFSHPSIPRSRRASQQAVWHRGASAATLRAPRPA